MGLLFWEGLSKEREIKTISKKILKRKRERKREEFLEFLYMKLQKWGRSIYRREWQKGRVANDEMLYFCFVIPWMIYHVEC